MKILVTGAAGFIGYHLSAKLLADGFDVVGIDNLNDYYDVNLKIGRLNRLGIHNFTAHCPAQSDKYSSFRFIKCDLLEREIIQEIFKSEKFDAVCHLAAQAGVRYSITNPYSYIDSNIVGFINILEACRQNRVGHLAYASSSSVYGLNRSMPFKESDGVDHPASLYAATKKANEVMAHSYSHLYGLPTTGLRFFTVYGPWGRPDMAPFLFTKSILNGESIKVFNYGDMERDFTYIDDIVNGLVRVIVSPAEANPNWHPETPATDSSSAPYRIYNIGNSKPVRLLDFIGAIENSTGVKAQLDMQPIQPGDVKATWADVSRLSQDFNYKPNTDLQFGIDHFVDWYRNWYNI